MAQLMTLMIENALGLIFAVSLAARLGGCLPRRCWSWPAHWCPSAWCRCLARCWLRCLAT